MERKLNQSELEMLGLQEGTISTPSPAVKNDKGLEQYLGMFVKVGIRYGMIDDVHGDRLGFVWSDKDSWTGELVRQNIIDKCVSDSDIKKAERSARTYFEREVASLRARIKRGYEFDDQKMLRERVDLCESWLKWLG